MTKTGCLLIFITGLIPVIAWFNHIFTCFEEEMWGFLIAGTIFFPVGMLHGMWLWFQ